MARLDGERKNPFSWMIAVALLALLGVGGYFLLQNRGTSETSSRSNDVGVVSNRPSDAHEADANETATPTLESSPAPGSTPDANAMGAPGTTADLNATPTNATALPGTMPGAAVASDSDMTPSGDATATPAATSSTDVSDASGTPQPSAQDSSSHMTTDGETRKRSKTITNNKTGVTTTYSKEVHPNGKVSHSMTRTTATGAPTQ